MSDINENMKYVVYCSDFNLSQMMQTVRKELNKNVEVTYSGPFDFHHVVTDAPEEYVSKFASITKRIEL